MLHHVYESMMALIEDSQNPTNVSLATYKPKEIVRAQVIADHSTWDKDQEDFFAQMSIFDQESKPLRKLPFIFKYEFIDSMGSKHSMQILAWEIGALYFSCFRNRGSEEQACQDVINKLNSLAEQRDMHFVLGTTLEHHSRSMPNPFTIVGLYYPPKDDQLNIFDTIQ